MTPRWQYDESRHPGEDFDSQAEVYDETHGRVRDVGREIEEVISFLDLKPDQAVLEMGAGTGEFSLAAARLCARVYAVDLSEGMLRRAEEKAARGGVENVEFIGGGFLTYEHRGLPLDAAVTQFALHHLPDFWKQVALMRLAGMVKDGGKLCLRDVVYSFPVQEHGKHIEGYVAWMAEKGGQGIARSVTGHIRDEYSTLAWIMEGMIMRAGFEVVRAEYKSGFLATYLCEKSPSS